MFVGGDNVKISLRSLPFEKGTFFGWSIILLLLFNLFPVHYFYLFVWLLLQFFPHFNVELEFFDFFVFGLDFFIKFDLFGLHKIDFLNVVWESSFILVKIYFLLVLGKFWVHFSKLILDFGHMVFVWSDKLTLLCFEESVDFAFQVVSESANFDNGFRYGLGVLLF